MQQQNGAQLTYITTNNFHIFLIMTLLYNNRGISVHAFEFSWAESLSARRVG